MHGQSIFFLLLVSFLFNFGKSESRIVNLVFVFGYYVMKKSMVFII